MRALQWNLTAGVTPISHDIYRLHMTVFWVCVAIGIIVFGVMLYSILYHRKSRLTTPAQFHEHPGVELTWTIIPFLILVAVAIPGTQILMHINDSSKPDLTIKITGYQWKWRYEYLDQKIQFFSNLSTPFKELQGMAPKNPAYLQQVDHPLVVPIHKKIRFLVTGNDVIHSWWVPDFGVKQDAVPGFINETWARINRPGIYYGQCAELCGVNHAFMPIVVIAMSETDFAKWVVQQGGTLSTSAESSTGSSATAVVPTGVPTTTAPPASSTASHGTPNVPQITPATASATSASAIAATPTATAPTAPTAANVSTAANQPVPMTKDELMKKGEAVYQSVCVVCHMPNGEGMPPTFPALKKGPITTGPLPAHINRVLNGKPGTAMQAFRDQLTDQDIAAVITYERNSWENNKGDLVQPQQINEAKALPPAP